MRDDSAKEEIRRRIDIVAYISRYVPLQRSGRRYRARCPFHEERHPSFYVDPASGLWKCFGCGAAGDIFTFVQRVHNLTFPEAAEQLAREAGVEWRPAARGPGRSVRQAVLRANELALRFFVEQLQSSSGRRAVEYLASRGIDEETMRTFELGYAPEDGQALMRYMASRGFTQEALERAGLVHASGRDMFVDRVMFPVRDVAGRVVGFGGRALSDDEPAKYINSPDTAVFKKGQTLYALHLARDAAAESGRLIIVEGYTDVIAAHQAGLRNVVACLGTALTGDHLRIASRYADVIVLAYDADAAGAQAAMRDVSMFESCPAEVRIALLPEGHDPDSLVRSQGGEALQAVAERALPVVEFRLKQVMAAYEEGEDRAAVLSEAAGILAQIPDRARRMEVLDRVADWCGGGDAQRTAMLRRALWLEVGRKLREARRAAGTGESERREADDRDVIVKTVAGVGDGVAPGRQRLERTLLEWAVLSEDIAERIMGEVGPEYFCAPGHRAIAAAVWRQVVEGEFAPDCLPDEVGSDELTQTVVAEILLKDAAPPTEEELAAAVRRLHTWQVCGTEELRWEQTAVASPEELGEADEAELEELRQEITQRIDRGEITPDDPLYQKYLRLVERLHGRGGVDYYEARYRRVPLGQQRGGARGKGPRRGGNG